MIRNLFKFIKLDEVILQNNLKVNWIFFLIKFIFFSFILSSTSYSSITVCSDSFTPDTASGLTYIPSCSQLVGTDSTCLSELVKGVDDNGSCKACTGMTCEQCVRNLGNDRCNKVRGCSKCSSSTETEVFQAILSSPVGFLQGTDSRNFPESMDLIMFGGSDASISQYFNYNQFQSNCSQFPFYYDPRFYISNYEYNRIEEVDSAGKIPGLVAGDIFCQHVYNDPSSWPSLNSDITLDKDNLKQIKKQWVWVTPDVCSINPGYCRDLPFCNECFCEPSDPNCKLAKSEGLCAKGLCYARGTKIYTIDSEFINNNNQVNNIPEAQACWNKEDNTWHYNGSSYPIDNSGAVNMACNDEYGSGVSAAHFSGGECYQCELDGETIKSPAICNNCGFTNDITLNSDINICNCDAEEPLLCLHEIRNNKLGGNSDLVISGLNETIVINDTENYQHYALQQLLNKSCGVQYGEEYSVIDTGAINVFYRARNFNLESESLQLQCIDPDKSKIVDSNKKIYIKSCAKNPKCLTYDNLEVTTTFIKKKKKIK